LPSLLGPCQSLPLPPERQDDSRMNNEAAPKKSLWRTASFTNEDVEELTGLFLIYKTSPKRAIEEFEREYFPASDELIAKAKAEAKEEEQDRARSAEQYAIRQEHIDKGNQYDGEWPHFTTPEGAASGCGKGSILYQTDSGTFRRIPMYCNDWTCLRCATKKRKDKMDWLYTKCPVDPDGFFVSQSPILADENNREVILSRIRPPRGGGGYMLVRRDDGSYTIVSNQDFSQGRKSLDIKVSASVRYPMRLKILDRLTAFPGIAYMSFGGKWSRPGTKRKPDTEEGKLVAAHRNLTMKVLLEIMEYLGATYIKYDNSWESPEGESTKQFRVRLMKELKRCGFRKKKRKKSARRSRHPSLAPLLGFWLHARVYYSVNPNNGPRGAMR